MIEELILKRYSKVSGTFGPFTYAIGLDSPLQEVLTTFQGYPLQQPVSELGLSRFLDSLTFVHEAAHLGQYISSAYGLRALRQTIICNRYLLEKPGWQLPLGSSLLPKLRDGNEYEVKTFARLLSFLDTADQLRLHVASRPAGGNARLKPLLTWEQWSAHFFMLPDAKTRARMLDELGLAGTDAHPLPHIVLPRGDREEDVVLNVAVLMEAFALAVEMNQILNAFGIDRYMEMLRLVPDGSEYLAAALYGMGSGSFTSQNLLPTLSICVDLALMYDTFVLFDTPVLEWSQERGRVYKYPGEVFIMACDAAKKIPPIETEDQQDYDRFYYDLCSALGFPSPEWMATRAYEVVMQIIANSSGDLEDRWLGKALRMHSAGLEYRCKYPASLPIRLMTTDGIFDLLEACGSNLTFYNLGTRTPHLLHPKNLDLLSLHTLIVQAITSEHIECPLMHGVPIVCPSATADAQHRCAWQIQDGGITRCLADLFVEYAGLESPNQQ